ncbi:MAG: sarcosine oxidase subunit beta family protein [Pseudomonadota bacterium]
MRYSAWEIFKQGLTGNKSWPRMWRDPEPKSGYDIVIVGGGGHGLSTAHHLAHRHGLTNVAVVEKGWIGGGNVGRNTTMIRSNYLLAGNQPFYELSLQLWENLEQEINYNAMVSQRGILNLAHTDAQRDAYIRRGNSMRLSGAGGEWWDRKQIAKHLPMIDLDTSRFPVIGGLWQPRAGTVRHDAVAWGYARSADSAGVDILQNTEVTGFIIEGGKCCGVMTSKGPIRAEKVAVCVAGSSSRVMNMADIRLPIESHALQAFVTEGVKPFLPCIVTYGTGHFYICQSDKGGLVFGGDIEAFSTYAQRGDLSTAEHVMEVGLAMMPALARARVLRNWGGLVDMSMDGSPIIDRTEMEGLYFNGGWCYGGFKATPASGYCYAHLLATDTSHDVASAMTLDRFATGAVIDENGRGATPNLH